MGLLCSASQFVSSCVVRITTAPIDMCSYLMEHGMRTSFADHCTKVVDEVAILIDSIIRSCTNHILRIGVDGDREVGLSSIELKCIDDSRELGRVIGPLSRNAEYSTRAVGGWMRWSSTTRPMPVSCSLLFALRLASATFPLPSTGLEDPSVQTSIAGGAVVAAVAPAAGGRWRNSAKSSRCSSGLVTRRPSDRSALP